MSPTPSFCFPYNASIIPSEKVLAGFAQPSTSLGVRVEDVLLEAEEGNAEVPDAGNGCVAPGSTRSAPAVARGEARLSKGTRDKASRALRQRVTTPSRLRWSAPLCTWAGRRSGLWADPVFIKL